MKKIFWILFCLIELTLPVLGGNLPGGISPEIPSRPAVADGPQLSVNVTTGSCNPNTNQYTLSGTINLTNAVAASLTITDGSATTTLNVSAGQTSASFSLAGLQAGSGVHTVTVSGGGSSPAPPTTGGFAIAGVNTISCTTLSPTQRQIRFTPQYTGLNGSSVTFAVAGELGATTTPGPYTLNLYADNPSITLNALQSNVQSTYRYNWLEVCNNSSAGYSASTTYTAPASCANTTAQLTLAKRVDKAKAAVGDIMTYTLVITNNSSNALNNVVVRDSMSTGLTYQTNSATPPAGTVFTKGALTTSTWTINSLAAGQTLALTLRAKADSSGVLYNVATTTGVIAKACTSIPIKVCTGDTYVFRLILPSGRTNYKWFRNDVEIAGQTTNILDVTTPGAYRMSSDNNAGSCTEYSCCPFIIEEEALPAFQAIAQAASCSGNTPQNNASITLTGFNASHSFQYSAGSSFNPAASLSGAAQPIPANGILVNNLANPASAQSYTVRVYNGGGCYTDATVQVQPATCSPSGGTRLALSVTPGSCSSATNQYTLSGTLSLTNAVAASLVITDGSVSTTLNVTAGQTSANFSLAGLPSGSGSRTVSVSGTGYTTTSATYSAPASCSTTPTPTPNPPILALSVTPGSCNPATNRYTLSGTLSLTNAVAASLTITDGSASTTLNVTAGQTSASFSLTGLASGSGTRTVTVSGAGYNPASTTGSFAIVGMNTISCTPFGPTSSRVSFTPQYTGTNGNPITFAMNGQIASTTTPGPYTKDLYTDNPAILVTAQQGSVQSSFTYKWVEACSNGGSAPTGYAASATYTAPASCSTTPTPTPNPPGLALSVTPGSCNPATNQYTLSGTVSLTNAVAASLTITDGSASTTLNISAGQTSANFSLAGLPSGSGSRTVSVSGAGYTTTSATYSAPASCSTTPTPTPNPPGLALSVTPGSCNPATNQYTLSGTLSLTNAVAASLTITDGSASTTLNIIAGQTSASFSLAGLPSGSGSRTVSVSGTGYTTTSATYSAPASCSTTPTPTPNPPILALSVTPGSCNPATNQYTLSGIVSLTNAVAASLTITDGSASTILNVTAGQTSASFSLTGLASGSGTRTVTVSGAGYNPASTTGSFAIVGMNTISCTPFGPTSSRVSFTPQYTGTNGNPITFAMNGLIAPTTATGPYSLTLYTDNPAILVTAQQGSVQSSFTYKWVEACSNGGSAPTGYAASATYTAPASCSTTPTPTPNPPGLALSVTPGSCSSATNQYTLSGTVSLTNAVAASLTITDGSATTSLNISAGQTSASFSLAGLPSGSGSRTVSVSGTGYTTTSATYSAPASCSTTPTPTPNPPGLALSVTPGSCNPATNQYTLSGTLSLTNAVAASLTITDGSSSTTLNVTAGQTSASFSLAGLQSGSGTRTVTVSGAGYNPASTTGSFAIVGMNTISCTPFGPTSSRVSFTPQYTGTNGNPITFAMNGLIAPTTATGPYSLTLYTDNPAILVTAQQGSVQSSFTYKWVEACSNGGSAPTGYAASATYSAPASCSTTPTPTPNPPGLALSVTPGSCNPATNRYTLTGTITLTNAVSSSLLITDGTINKILPVTAGQTTASFDFTGLTSGSGSHTVIVSDMGYTTPAPINSPAHIAIVGVTTVNCLTLSAGLRQVLFTPQYAGLTNEPVSFSVANELLPTTNPGPYSVKLYTDNPMITLYAQQGGSHDSFRYNWLQACSTNPGSTTTGVGYTPVSAVYQAPASCSVSAPASGPAPTASALALTVRPETCDPATNQYKLTGVINLTNAVAGSLLVTDGSLGTIVPVTDGQTSATFNLMGLASGTGDRKVTVSESSYTPVTFSSDGPFSMPGVTIVSCVAINSTQRQVTIAPQYTGVNGGPISFSVTNELLPTTAAGPYVLNLYLDNPVVTLNARQGQEQSVFRYRWVEACANSRPVVSKIYAPASTNYTAPAACVATPQVSLAVTSDTTVNKKSPNGRIAASPGLPLKLVDKSKAKVGDVLTYTLVLTNSGTTDLVNAVVRDSASIGLTYVPNSATAPAGTIFTPGNKVSTWTVATLAPNERVSLVFKAKVDTTGILYNTATVQGDTAIVCTSVPTKVCPGSVYSFSLVARQGRTTYRWFRNGMEIPGETNHILVVTAPGSYSLDPSGGTGICPDFSCCPFIVEFDTLSAFTAMTVPVTCTGTTPQANGRLLISDFDPTFTYQYSAGTQFNPSASLSGGGQPIPAGGVLANNLANPGSSQPYTVRVYNNSGCYRDVTTMLMPTVCACPPDVCIPYVIKKNTRAR